MFVEHPEDTRCLCRSGQLLRVRTVVFVPERKASADTSGLEDKRDLLKSRTSYDVASGVTYDFGGSLCFV